MKWKSILSKISLSIAMVLLCISCTTVKPLELKPITAPMLETIQRPEISVPEIEEFTLTEKGEVCYNVNGQNKITAKVQSERMAWQQVEHLKLLVSLYADLAKRYQEWVIEADLQRQMEEKRRREAEMKSIATEILAIIAVIAAIAL